MIENSEEDPLKVAYARGEEMKRDLLRKCGALSLSEVTRLLCISHEAVGSLCRQGRLVAVPEGNELVYPSVQFDGAALVEHLPELLLEIGSSSWTALDFLVTESAQLGQRSPLQVLKSGSIEERAVVFRMARILAGDGFS